MNIAELRKAKNLTQRELALAVGATEATIRNWETGRSASEWFVCVYRLCKALDCEIGDIVREPNGKAD